MRLAIVVLLGCTPSPTPGAAHAVASTPASAPASATATATATASVSASASASASSSAKSLAEQLDALEMGTLASIDGKLVVIDKNGQIVSPKPAGASSGSPTSSPPSDDATKVKAAVGEVSQGAAKGGRPGDDSVIARNRWRFKACYNKALASDPTAGGSASFTVKIAADGSVTSTASTSGLSPASLDACARGSFGAMKFEQPGPATIVVPLFFTAKKPE